LQPALDSTRTSASRLLPSIPTCLTILSLAGHNYGARLPALYDPRQQPSARGPRIKREQEVER
jgi:hypothetical protein